MAATLAIVTVIALLFIFGPRPKLDGAPRQSQVPQIPLQQLPEWLAGQEGRVPNLIEGNAAHIVWADADKPAKTPYCFLYIHGFSATWHETAPMTEKLAQQRGANIVQGRLAGHGEGEAGMLTPAEHWLQSVADHFDIASRLGDKVIIVATSTGCTLSTWLLDQPLIAQKVHACIFMSPNFRIRSPFGFLLTWPFSPSWIHLILGRVHEWDEIGEGQATTWTTRYSTLALIEMQKTVDFVSKIDFGQLHTPMATLYMQNDGTIHPPTAIQVFNRWGAKHKRLIRVEPNGDAAEHVFVGDIVSPERNEWCLTKINAFLEDLPE